MSPPTWTLYAAAVGAAMQLVGVIFLALDVRNQRHRLRERLNTVFGRARLTGGVDLSAAGHVTPESEEPPTISDRVEALEKQSAAMRNEIAEMRRTLSRAAEEAAAGAVGEAFRMVQDLRSALLGELQQGSGSRQWGAWLIVAGTAVLLAGAVGALVLR